MQHWKAFDPATLALEAVQKAGKTRVAPLAQPVLLQTPAFELTAPILTEDGDAIPCAYLRPPSEFLDLLERTEKHILDLCVAVKADWAPSKTDDDLRANFKSFLKEGTLKASLPDHCLFFDAAKAPCARADVGTHARAILQLERVVFGKTEFGALWRVVQLQALPEPEGPKCLMLSDEEEGGPAPADDDDDDDLREFD